MFFRIWIWSFKRFRRMYLEEITNFTKTDCNLFLFKFNLFLCSCFDFNPTMKAVNPKNKRKYQLISFSVVRDDMHFLIVPNYWNLIKLNTCGIIFCFDWYLKTQHFFFWIICRTFPLNYIEVKCEFLHTLFIVPENFLQRMLLKFLWHFLEAFL